VRIGDDAVAPLQAAYGHSGWLEKVSIGLISRHTNRRVQIARALRDLGSPAAGAALQALLDTERDANLRLRLQEGLHELGARERAAGGS
jgi:HEAT repeat protein